MNALVRACHPARVATAVGLALALTVVAVGASASPAQAAEVCHTNRGSSVPDAEVGTYYPVLLHNRFVRLYTDRGNASAFAIASLDPGDVLTIDRSNSVLAGGGADHYWLTTDQVAAEGSWDHCPVTNPLPYAFPFATPRIDGAHRAVRVCLRHNGALECAWWWYQDNDDDADDWF